MNRMLTVIAASLALAAVGCEEKKEAPSVVEKAGDALKDAGHAAKDAASKAGDKLGDMAEKAKNATSSTVDDLLKAGTTALPEKVNGWLAEWKPTVEKLKGKASSAAADVKPQLESAVSGIESQWKKVEASLAEFKNAGASDLKKIGSEVMDGADKLGTMIKDAAAKYMK